MPILETMRRGGGEVALWTQHIDEATRAQLAEVASLPIIAGHVAAMPDVHLGMGCTVGSVIATRAAIIPGAVGVDIGCGMLAVETSLEESRLPDSLARVRAEIEARVPVGRQSHPVPTAGGATLKRLGAGLDRIVEKAPTLGQRKKGGARPIPWAEQVGTLGGGNHFLEVAVDEDTGRVWAMLHSGSRGVGNMIGSYYTERAKEQRLARDGRLDVDRALAWLDEGSQSFDDYVEAVGWAQGYAHTNRRQMMDAMLEAMRETLPPFTLEGATIDCHHNYVAHEEHHGENVWLTRKGAINAEEGRMGIVPGSMGTGSYIVRGKGHPESYNSCAHGAGRRMSRTAAKAKFGIEEVAEQTRGVECRKDAGIADEAPGAYKDIAAVIAEQSDLAEPVHRLRQVVCVKG